MGIEGTLSFNRNLWLGQVPLVVAAAPQAPLVAPVKRLGSAAVLTDAIFSQALSAPRAVIDFWSPSCPYCMAYKPVFEAAAAQSGPDLLMATVDVNASPQAAGTYKIQTIPATIFLVNGQEVHRVEGQIDQGELQAAIAQAFSASAAPTAKGSSPWGWIAGGAAALGLLTFALTR